MRHLFGGGYRRLFGQAHFGLGGGGQALRLEEIYRFENTLVQKNGRLCWDMERLAGEVLRGPGALPGAGSKSRPPWALTPGRWTTSCWMKGGSVLGDTVAYRDSRTQGMDKLVEQRWSPSRSSTARTGIQKQDFNTIYQLMAVKTQEPRAAGKGPAPADGAGVPDLPPHRQDGERVHQRHHHRPGERPHQNLGRGAFGYAWAIPAACLGSPACPATAWAASPQRCGARVGFDCQVLFPATHDTGSAFLAVPAKEDGVYLSSGTWSLLGTELPEPVTTPESLARNFTNEGGYRYRFRYLKNIMGLWMLQSIRREAGEGVYLQRPGAGRPGGGFLPRPGGCGATAASWPRRTWERPSAMPAGKRASPCPRPWASWHACVYHSLAQSYAQSVQELSALTGREYTAVNIVGGGSRDGYLNQLTANATGLPVYAGPTEGTALGNLMVQMLAAWEFPDLAAIRKAVRHSFSIQEVLPC